MPGSAGSKGLLLLVRLLYVTAFIMGYLCYDHLQHLITALYRFLLGTRFFNSVYFETLWTTMVYPCILLAPVLMDKIPALDRYKLDPKVRWHSTPMTTALMEAAEYATPLILLDTFMVKKYWGVDPKEWDIRRRDWIQVTRALPEDPPTVFQIFYQLVCSFVIYDILFFMAHYACHRYHRLYKHLHSRHHDHEVVFSRVTNQLTVVERVLLVLSANQALKLVRGHPLTRAIFVPLFLAALTENHCGYDLPWTLDKVVPWGLVGGSPRHYAHHEYGTRHYQPFLTYIDNYLHPEEDKKARRLK